MTFDELIAAHVASLHRAELERREQLATVAVLLTPPEWWHRLEFVHVDGQPATVACQTDYSIEWHEAARARAMAWG